MLNGVTTIRLAYLKPSPLVPFYYCAAIFGEWPKPEDQDEMAVEKPLRYEIVAWALREQARFTHASFRGCSQFHSRRRAIQAVDDKMTAYHSGETRWTGIVLKETGSRPRERSKKNGNSPMTI
jgi:hypothetical protein